MAEFVFDKDRQDRLGFSEAIFGGGKTAEQIISIIHSVALRPLLVTRLSAEKFEAVRAQCSERIAYSPKSNVAVVGMIDETSRSGEVAIVAAGTSDMPAALEAAETLKFHGFEAPVIADVGVAGLWRLQARLDEIAAYRVVIAVAGMDAALPTVLGGLIQSLIIGVPTSVGYGAARDGETALMSMLTSCAPGLVTVNIDNGYGAAMAAIRALGR